MAPPWVSHCHSSNLLYLIVCLFIAGEDYIAVNKSVIFYPGYEKLQCVHIPILNDECLEESMEVFNVSLSSKDSNVVVDGTSEIEVYIWDDDGMIL